jgi:hypothetical protein
MCRPFCLAGAWLLDDSSYYSAGKFLSVSNNVFSFIQSVQHSTNAEISLLHIQLLAAAYQHAILRDAYAIAKALKRILILPPLYSWCDWEPDSNVLLTCVAKHNEGQVPYQGPSDLYVNIEVCLFVAQCSSLTPSPNSPIKVVCALAVALPISPTKPCTLLLLC